MHGSYFSHQQQVGAVTHQGSTVPPLLTSIRPNRMMVANKQYESFLDEQRTALYESQGPSAAVNHSETHQY